MRELGGRMGIRKSAGGSTPDAIAEGPDITIT
jgi:hypothetical protein